MYSHGLRAYFYCYIIFHCLDGPPFIYPSPEGHLHHFRVLAITDEAAVDIPAQVLWGDSFRLLWINTKKHNYFGSESSFSGLRRN